MLVNKYNENPNNQIMIIVIIHDQHDTSDISKRMIIVRIEDGALLFLLTGEPRKECSAAIRSYVDIDCDVPHIPIYTQTYTSYSHTLSRHETIYGHVAIRALGYRSICCFE